MKCVICKTGDCLPGVSNFTHIASNKLVLVKNVKATVCNNCGEAYFDTEAVNYIQQKTKEAIKNNEDVELFSV
jgi:YgiT-type zinc finger domain-containing protein